MSACCSLMASVKKSLLLQQTGGAAGYILHLLFEITLLSTRYSHSEFMRCHSGFITLVFHPQVSWTSWACLWPSVLWVWVRRVCLWVCRWSLGSCRTIWPLPWPSTWRRPSEVGGALEQTKHTHTHLQPWPKESASRYFCRPACSSHTERHSRRRTFKFLH